MRATRRTQPYRAKRGRQPGPALTAMLRGGPAHLPNPQDIKRRTQRLSKRRGGLRGVLAARGR
jgi:hypothetical protein